MQLLLSVVLVISLSFCCVSGVLAPPSAPVADCSAAPSSFCARTGCSVWYIDPVNGNDTTGDGSSAKPWSTLTYVIRTYVNISVFVNYTNASPFPPNWATDFRPLFSTRVPVQPGDVIVLREGYQTRVALRGAYLPIPVTIIGEAGGRKSYVHSLFLESASNWRIFCLNFAPPPCVDSIGGDITAMVRFAASARGYSFNNTIESNNITSYTDAFMRSPAVAASKELLGNSSATGIMCYAFNSVIRNNNLARVRRGIETGAENIWISRNRINYLSADGLRHGGVDGYVIEYNVVTNIMAVDGDHRDCFQLYAGRGQTYNMTIRNNVCIADYDSTRPWHGEFQGTSFFDDPVENCQFHNNLIVAPTYHGIYINSGKNCEVFSNTVFSPDFGFKIRIGGEADGQGGIVAKNNYAVINGFNNLTTVANNTFLLLNNVTAANYFVDYVNFDFRPKPGGPLVGAGTSVGVPTIDITGATRTAPYDIGAYRVNAPTPNFYDAFGAAPSACQQQTTTGGGSTTTPSATSSPSATATTSPSATATTAPTTVVPTGSPSAGHRLIPTLCLLFIAFNLL